MSAWAEFWNWYENKILGSVIIITIIQFIQIPHMICNADNVRGRICIKSTSSNRLVIVWSRFNRNYFNYQCRNDHV